MRSTTLPRRRLRASAWLSLPLTALLVLAGAPAQAATTPTPTAPPSTTGCAVTKGPETRIADNAQNGSIRLNGGTIQQDALVSHKGWTYTAYYSGTGADRYVTVGRRPGPYVLASTPAATRPPDGWQLVELRDYVQRADDAHNTISIGISPNDGTLHLAFDHHVSPLHYRRSVAGLLDDPLGTAWTPAAFEAVTNRLGGQVIDRVTYPRFVTTPGGQLLLSLRRGGSGAGDEHLYSYRTSTRDWAVRGAWINGEGERNAYLNGLSYDPQGVLHASWVWRETGDAATNHDLMYASSRDNGLTWLSTTGRQIGVTGTSPMQDGSPDVRVWTIPQGTGLINQEGQFSPGNGRMHVVQRERVGTALHYIHFYRSLSGTWFRRDTGVVHAGRAKIVTDARNNAYILAGGGKILCATGGSGYTDWSVVHEEAPGRFGPEPLYDLPRLKATGVLSLYLTQPGSPNLWQVDHTLG